MVHRAAHDEQAGSACPAKALRWDCGGLVAIHCVSLAAMTFLRQHKVAPSSRLVSHLTVRALSMVSAVVKVLETTTAMVVAGSRLLSARATSTGSTLARNRSVRPRASSAAACRKASRVQVQQRYLAGVSDGSCLIAQCSASAASPSADDTSVLPSDTTGQEHTTPWSGPGDSASHLVSAQRGVHEERPQEGAADPDGDDVGDSLAGGAAPLAAAHAVAELLDLVQHLPHVWHHVLAVRHDGLQRWAPE